MSRVVSEFMDEGWKKKQVSRVVRISRRYMLARILRPCRTRVCSCFIISVGRCGERVVGGRHDGGSDGGNGDCCWTDGKLCAGELLEEVERSLLMATGIGRDVAKAYVQQSTG